MLTEFTKKPQETYISDVAHLACYMFMTEKLEKRLNKYVLFGKKEHRSTPQVCSCVWINHKTSGTTSFGQMMPKLKIFDHHATAPCLMNAKHACHHKHLVSTVKYSHRTCVPWVVHEPHVYRSILESNVSPLVWQEKIGPNWAMK